MLLGLVQHTFFKMNLKHKSHSIKCKYTLHILVWAILHYLDAIQRAPCGCNGITLLENPPD